MRNLTIKVVLPLLIGSVLVLTGCNKDKEDPTITVTAPAEHTHYNGGDVVNVAATFADDKALASYTLEIGDDSGGHIHSFHHNDAGNITGETSAYTQSITIPDSAGVHVFFLHFTVTDEEGKTTSAKHMLHID